MNTRDDRPDVAAREAARERVGAPSRLDRRTARGRDSTDDLADLVDELQGTIGNRVTAALLRQYGIGSPAPASAPAPHAPTPSEGQQHAAPDAPTPTSSVSTAVPTPSPAQASPPLHRSPAAVPARHDDAATPAHAEDEAEERANEEHEEQGEPRGVVQAAAAIGLEGGPMGPELAGRIEAKRGGGAPLDEPLRRGMEGAFGASFSDVGVHHDAEADALSQRISALAFTTGRDIFFRWGAYQPHSPVGQRLLAHELTHVVQQRGLSPGGGGPLTVGPAGDTHEQEAEATSAAVAETLSAGPAASPTHAPPAASPDPGGNGRRAVRRHAIPRSGAQALQRRLTVTEPQDREDRVVEARAKETSEGRRHRLSSGVATHMPPMPTHDGVMGEAGAGRTARLDHRGAPLDGALPMHERLHQPELHKRATSLAQTIEQPVPAAQQAETARQTVEQHSHSGVAQAHEAAWENNLLRRARRRNETGDGAMSPMAEIVDGGSSVPSAHPTTHVRTKNARTTRHRGRPTHAGGETTAAAGGRSISPHSIPSRAVVFDSRGVNLYKHQDTAVAPLERIPVRTTVTVLGYTPPSHDHPDWAGWCEVSVPHGQRGFVSGFVSGFVNSSYLDYDMPEPEATLFVVQPGDKAWAIVARASYIHHVTEDAGYYVNLLVHVNKPGTFRNTRPDIGGVDHWKGYEVVAGETIWIPSQAYADGMRGVVPSGSHWSQGLAGFILGAVQLGGQVISLVRDTVGGAVQFVLRIGDAAIHIGTEAVVATTNLLAAIAAAVADPAALPGLLGQLVANLARFPNILVDRVIHTCIGLFETVIEAYNAAQLAEANFLWIVISRGFKGFLGEMRKKPARETAMLLLHLAGLILNPSSSFAWGVLKGVAEGVWSGVTGLFKLVGDAFEIAHGLFTAVQTISHQLRNPAVRARINRDISTLRSEMAPILAELSTQQGRAQALRATRQVAHVIAGLVEEKVGNMAEAMGNSIAAKLLHSLSGSDESIGEDAGKLAGSVLFNAALTYFTDGVYGAAAAALPRLAEIVEEAGAHVGTLVTALERALPSVLHALSSVKVAATSALGRQLGAVAKTLANLLERLLGLATRADREEGGATGAAGDGERGAQGRHSTRDHGPQTSLQRRLDEAMAAALLAVAPLTGRRISAASLEVLLGPLQAAYRLQVLKPIQRGDVWAIYGRINPEQEDLTGVHIGSDHDPAIDAATDAKAWTDLGVSANVARALSRPDIDVSLRQHIRDTLVTLDNARKTGSLDINGSKTFRDLVGDLATGTPDKVSQSFAELAHAKHVLEQPDLDPAVPVYIGAQYRQELKGLPTIDVEDVEADSYYRTLDGVVHLDEVKETPNAFVTKISKSDQFKRYREWLGKGPKRKVGVDIQNGGPRFHRILEEKVLKSLEQTIAPNSSEPFFKVGDRIFSMKELRQLYQDALHALEHIRQANPQLDVGTLLDRYFDTLEETLHTIETTGRVR